MFGGSLETPAHLPRGRWVFAASRSPAWPRSLCEVKLHSLTVGVSTAVIFLWLLLWVQQKGVKTRAIPVYRALVPDFSQRGLWLVVGFCNMFQGCMKHLCLWIRSCSQWSFGVIQCVDFNHRIRVSQTFLVHRQSRWRFWWTLPIFIWGWSVPRVKPHHINVLFVHQT